MRNALVRRCRRFDGAQAGVRVMTTAEGAERVIVERLRTDREAIDTGCRLLGEQMRILWIGFERGFRNRLRA